jgi:ribosomal protein S27AE
MTARKNPGRDLAALRKRHRKSCPVCGETFTAINTAKYCSGKCRQKAYRTKSED